MVTTARRTVSGRPPLSVTPAGRGQSEEPDHAEDAGPESIVQIASLGPEGRDDPVGTGEAGGGTCQKVLFVRL